MRRSQSDQAAVLRVVRLRRGRRRRRTCAITDVRTLTASEAKKSLGHDPPDSAQSGSLALMNSFRIALANLRFPATREESVALAEGAIAEASAAGAGLVALPECYDP